MCSSQRIVCPVCRRDDGRKIVIKCSRCDTNFHSACVGLSPQAVRALQAWLCPGCTRGSTQECVRRPRRTSETEERGEGSGGGRGNGERLRPIDNIGSGGDDDDDAGRDGGIPGDDGSDLLDYITRQQCRVLLRIPKGARPLAASTFTEILMQLLDSGLASVDAWRRLLCFGYCCLKSPRAGRKHRAVTYEGTLATKVKENLRNYVDGPQPVRPRRATTRRFVPDCDPDQADVRLAELVSEKLADYNVSGAVRLAASDAKAVVAPSPAVIESLKNKHPPAPAD